MSTRIGKPHPESRAHVLCPYCETPCERGSSVPFCPGCGRAWSFEGDEVVFDDARRAEKGELEAALRVEESRRASASGLQGDARRRPVRLGKKGPPRPR